MTQQLRKQRSKTRRDKGTSEPTPDGSEARTRARNKVSESASRFLERTRP